MYNCCTAFNFVIIIKVALVLLLSTSVPCKVICEFFIQQSTLFVVLFYVYS